MSYGDSYPPPPEDGPPPGTPPGGPPPGYQQPPPGYQQQAPGYGGPPPGPYQQPVGVVPPSLEGVAYNKGLVILLTIITCGLFGIYWTFQTSEDLKKYNGDGLGGVVGVIIYLVFSVVLMFTIPSEIEKMYQRDGRESPENAMLGLWFLLPIIGNIIWYLKVQDALNDFWMSKGSWPPA